MLIEQLYRIGRAAYRNQPIVEIFLMLQNEVREESSTDKRSLLLMECDVSDLENITYEFKLHDYDEDQNTKYLLGLTGGNSVNYSLTLSPSYKQLTDKKINKKKRTVKFDKMVRILKQEVSKASVLDLVKEANAEYEEDIDILTELLQFIDDNQWQINLELDAFFKEKDISKFNNPLVITLKKDEDGAPQFPGEIDAYHKLYQILFLEGIDQQYDDADCQICGAKRGIRDGFNFGIFTLDQESFQTQFFRDRRNLNYQYIMCVDCYVYTLYGFLIAREHLNFYAYSVKEGRSSLSIYHYLIPMATDMKLLKKQLQFLAKAKEKYDGKIDQGIDKQINILDLKISKLQDKHQAASTKKAKKSLKKEMKANEEKKEKQEEYRQLQKNRFTLVDLLENLEDESQYLPIYDLYYKISDYKQTPKSKQIMSEVFLSTEHIRKLSDVFASVRKKMELVNRSLDLSKLKFLVQNRDFFNYFSALLSLQPVFKSRFDQICMPKIKSEFIRNVTANSEEQRRKHPYTRDLRVYQTYVQLFTEANLWRDE